MRTTFDFVDIIFKRLKDSALDAALTGTVYKTRPAGSTLEDVEIGSLPANNTEIQTAIINVNIYCRNMLAGSDGITTGLPNTARLKELANLAVPLLSDVWEGDYQYDIQQQHDFTEGSETYINFRVQFFNINVK